MVVILHEHRYGKWQTAPSSNFMVCVRQFPAHLLISVADPNRGKRSARKENNTETVEARDTYRSAPIRRPQFGIESAVDGIGLQIHGGADDLADAAGGLMTHELQVASVSRTPWSRSARAVCAVQ